MTMQRMAPAARPRQSDVARTSGRPHGAARARRGHAGGHRPFIGAASMSVAGALLAGALGGCLTVNPNLPHGMRTTEAGRGTAPSLPPFEASDEATAEQLERARDQGNAVRAELEWVRAHDAAASAEMAVGEYRVAFAVTPALPYAEPDAGGRLVHHEPASGEVHLGVAVRDAADGRLVPDLAVRATLVDARGQTLDRRALPFGYYPVLHRYGDNLRWPAAGPLTVRVEIAPPAYWRHDPSNGDRFRDSTTVEFTDVAVAPAALARVTRPPAPGGAADWADSAGLALALGEGAALGRALNEMANNVAVSGATTRTHDYLAYVAFERSEGYWEPHGHTHDGLGLRYTIEADESAARNAHLEIGMRDTLTGRFLPGMRPRATVLDAGGRVVGTYAPPFMWHPWIHHFGMNLRVPRSGQYTVRVHADAPRYRRYGRLADGMFAAPLDVELRDLKIVTGQK